MESPFATEVAAVARAFFSACSHLKLIVDATLDCGALQRTAFSLLELKKLLEIFR
jgi:hypothetical protein